MDKKDQEWVTWQLGEIRKLQVSYFVPITHLRKMAHGAPPIAM